jgi:hypothetical protein
MTSCPSCGTPVDIATTQTCPVCAWDFSIANAGRAHDHHSAGSSPEAAG